MVFNNYPLENSPSEYPNVHLLQFQRMGYEVRATVVHLKNIAAHKKFPFHSLKYNPQIEMFARFKMKSSFHKTKRII